MRPHVVLGLVILVALQVALTVSAHTPGGNPHSTPENLLPVAEGAYRLPYQNGANVFVAGDHVTHTAHNRFDLVATTSGQSIVAAGDGWIEYIQDSNDLTCPRPTATNPTPCTGYSGPSGSCCVRGTPGCTGCPNNYVWIRHPNGEWSKYSHMQVNTVPNSLAVGDWVSVGTVLGTEGDVGQANGAHLHFEVGVPDAIDRSLDPGDPGYDPLGINPASCNTCGLPGVSEDDPLLNDTGTNRQNRIPVFCGIGFVSAGNTYQPVACDGACQEDSAHIGTVVTDNNIAHEQRAGDVTSDMEVDAGAGAAVRSASQVRLVPGFRAETGSFFIGAIGPCDGPGF